MHPSTTYDIRLSPSEATTQLAEKEVILQNFCIIKGLSLARTQTVFWTLF